MRLRGLCLQRSREISTPARRYRAVRVLVGVMSSDYSSGPPSHRLAILRQITSRELTSVFIVTLRTKAGITELGAIPPLLIP